MALWCTGPEQVALKPANLGTGILVDMLYSGISRGTERLVWQGRVPVSEYERMRAPAQEGVFPYPVKYGYCAVGQVRDGPRAGRIVFALHPHQSQFRLADAALVTVPEAVPAPRAILAANMETALNIIWDSGASAGDRIAIVGAGLLGALVGYLSARLPGAEVTLVDINPGRATLAATFGCAFAAPDQAPRDCDVVINLSASAPGLALAIDLAGDEAAVVEGSWHGDTLTPIPLGGAFHSRRLRLISSQVGQVPATRRARWDYARRLSKALDLLADPVLDHLISGETAFNDLPAQYGAILNDPATLCHRIRYNTP